MTFDKKSGYSQQPEFPYLVISRGVNRSSTRNTSVLSGQRIRSSGSRRSRGGVGECWEDRADRRSEREGETTTGRGEGERGGREGTGGWGEYWTTNYLITHYPPRTSGAGSSARQVRR